MSIYLPPSLTGFEPRRMVFSTWVDHMPFGYDLVEALRPRMLVELGSYNGLSFFTFCQSMAENGVEGLCYAVDSWHGDEHTTGYDDTIFDDVQRHAREHYRGFAYLMRMLFNEALHHFEPDSIDLLHIDGLHTYEAVSEDFTNWWPRVRPGGVVLMHDVRARVRDYGAWKFWDEIAPRYPSFVFDHGFGLGVLRKPGGTEPEPPLLRALFGGDAGEQAKLRRFYVLAGEFLEARRQARKWREVEPKMRKGGQGKAAPGVQGVPGESGQ